MFYSNVASAPAQQLIVDGSNVTIPSSTLLFFIRAALRAVPVNESWYIKTYPDVGRAIAAGEIPSAKEHFIEHGYLEGRFPYKIVVDEVYYLRANPDVAQTVAQRHIPSGQHHFDHYGCKEGRIPFEGFDYFAETTPRQTDRLLGGRGMLFSRMRNRRAAKKAEASQTSESAVAPIR